MGIEKETIELKIDKWVNDGNAMSHKDGKLYFVRGGIPGETVLCEIIKQKSTHTFVEVIEVLEASDKRKSSDCEVFPKCGGCSFRHLEYTEEQLLKKSLLESEFLHRLKVHKELPKIGIYSGQINYYRNTVQLKRDKSSFGFYRMNSNELVEYPTSGCQLLPRDIDSGIQNRIRTQAFPAKGKLRKYREGILEYANQSGTILIKGRSLKIPPDGFIQIHSNLVDNWMDSILKFSSGKNALELFSGAGCITIFLAEKFKHIDAYELGESSVIYARKNARFHKENHLHFHQKNLYKLPPDANSEYDVCVANPPRAGLGNVVIQYLLDSEIPRIIYSSCDYLSLISDLSRLETRYRIRKMDLFDFFPRTSHFETLVVLEKI